MATDAEREGWLRKTLEHASATVPYYRKVWGDAWRAVTSPAQLAALPLLTKEEAIAHQEELLSGEPFPFLGVISSGTQHGERRPLRVVRVTEEAEALAAYQRDHREPSSAQPHHPPMPGARPGRAGLTRQQVEANLVLEVRAMHHGIPAPSSDPYRLRMPWTYTANALRLFEELVCRSHAGRNVVALHVGAGALMPLTAHLLAKGVDLSKLGVRVIGTYSFRLSPFWRDLVEEVWNADLYDNFSLSEFEGAAIECRTCGFNHWTGPSPLMEVLDPFTKQPVEQGTGVLVLTGLYPFVQAMPLCRYWTGDLVEWGPHCPDAGARGFRCRGRLRHSLLVAGEAGQSVVVAASDVTDFLEGRPEVARHPHPMEQLGLVKSPEIGAVKHELSWTDEARRQGLLRVELRFDPKIFSAQAKVVADELGAFLVERSPRLVALEAANEGELTIEVVAPGTLVPQWSKF